MNFDLTPGDVLTLSWGVDQYLPLWADQSLLLDVGLVEDEVDAVGVQVELTHVPTNMALTFHYVNEFVSKDRFQGESVELNFAMEF